MMKLRIICMKTVSFLYLFRWTFRCLIIKKYRWTYSLVWKYAHSSSETIEANFLIYSFKQQHLFKFPIPGSFGPLVLDSKRSCNMVNTTTWFGQSNDVGTFFFKQTLHVRNIEQMMNMVPQGQRNIVKDDCLQPR